MRYRVIWRPAAERHLTEAWLRATDRAAITAAANAIDVQLRDDPYGAGESREGRFRIIVETPLTVIYNISPDDMTVEVCAVWVRRQDTQ